MIWFWVLVLEILFLENGNSLKSKSLMIYVRNDIYKIVNLNDYVIFYKIFMKIFCLIYLMLIYSN